MTGKEEWNWEVGRRRIAPIGEWHKTYEWVEEPCVSHDGETFAAVVNTGDLAFSVCANGALWENTYDRVWAMQFTPHGKIVGLVSDMGQWSLAVDGVSWEEVFEYLWDIKLPAKSDAVVCAGKNGMDYFAVVNGEPWKKAFSNLTNLVAGGANGNVISAAGVQTVDFSEGDIDTFQQGCYSVAVNGAAWNQNFVNVWDIAISPDGKSVAAAVRTSLYDYTIAVDGAAWENSFSSVWKPEFDPADGKVTAAVKLPDGWTLAKDGRPVWNKRYVQLWHQQHSQDGSRAAAIVAPKFGLWTVAVDDHPWPTLFEDWVADIVFSPQGDRIACIGADKGRQSIVVDGIAWSRKFDQAWPVVFCPQGRQVAAKVKLENQFYLFVDGKQHEEAFSWMAPPVFSPDGEKILIRAIQGDGDNAAYERIVFPVADIRG